MQRVKLAPNWRERFSGAVVAAEARRRIEEVLTPMEQIAVLRDLLELVIRHGPDLEKWPTEAKHRKAEIDDMLNYIRDVNDRAGSIKTVPANPSSDKVWPTRVAKKGR